MKIGCQGWNYADWVTKAGGEAVFYPRGTRSNGMLEVYARAFGTVEVDSTFYAVPSAAVIDGWTQKASDGFSFSLKMPQEITHVCGLRRESFAVLDEFCERVKGLGEKLGAILIQLAPQFGADDDNIRALLEFLPRLPRGMRFAVEFRSREWLEGETLEILKSYNVALCLTEGAWIARGLMFDAAKFRTADFSYARFMGERDLTRFDAVQREQSANLILWHELLSEYAAANAFVYFSNFYEGFAPASANKLKKMFGQIIVEPFQLEEQPSLF